MRWFAARNQPTIEPPYGVDAKDRAVYADSAYPSKKHTQWLAQRGIEDRMIARAYRNKPLTDVQKAQNRLWADTRCTLGILKRHCGLALCCTDTT